MVLNKDGSFQRSARFRGPDLDSATPAELVGAAARLNNALRRLGSGWVIFAEAGRQPAESYPREPHPDPASALVDAERQAQFEEAGSHHERVCPHLRLAAAGRGDLADRVLALRGRTRGGVDPWELLRGFVDRTDRILQLIEGFVPEAAWLDDVGTLSYLHACISTRRQQVAVPEVPMHLDALLVDEPLVGGLEPRLGCSASRDADRHRLPGRDLPGILDELNGLAFPYRWSTRAICLDKTDAVRLLTRIRRQWFARRKSVAAILKEVMTGEASALVDTDAHNKAMDADAALQELGTDAIGQAYVTATITVWDEDAGVAAESCAWPRRGGQGRDFTCIAETVNAGRGWLGEPAGPRLRQWPAAAGLDPSNLAHMIPLSAVWACPDQDAHLDGPPLFYGQTEGSTPSCSALRSMSAMSATPW